MQQLNHFHLELARERVERELAQAAERARARSAQPESIPVRQRIGRSIIAIGARIAAEPQPRLARSA